MDVGFFLPLSFLFTRRPYSFHPGVLLTHRLSFLEVDAAIAAKPEATGPRDVTRTSFEKERRWWACPGASQSGVLAVENGQRHRRRRRRPEVLLKFP